MVRLEAGLALGTCALALAGCIVVQSPAASDTDATEDSSSSSRGSSGPATGATGSDSLTSTTSTVSTSSSSASTGDTDETATGQLESPPFTLYWTVSPPDTEVPDGSGIDIAPKAFVIGTSLSTTPGHVDLDEELAELEANILAEVPENTSEGVGVLVNGFWDATWCGASNEDHAAFEATELGAGLRGEELAAAWDTRATEILVALIERAQATRPNLQWGITGAPWHDYWELVRDDPGVLADWRDCQMMQPSVAPLWDAVDLVTVEIKHLYTGDSDTRREQNRLYFERTVETARLSEKPVVVVSEGRYRRSSDTDDNPFMNLPLLEVDLRNFFDEVRLAGAVGLVYEFAADECWNFDEGCAAMDPDPWDVAFENYWNDLVRPILLDVQSPPADG